LPSFIRENPNEKVLKKCNSKVQKLLNFMFWSACKLGLLRAQNDDDDDENL
jgi:hypothetical protein